MSTPSGRRWAGALLVLAALLALSVWTGLAVGPSGLGLGDAAQTELAARIVWRYRAPRVAAAALVGASLASAGLALQALLRNPLADPFILGLSGGAVAGASLLLLGGGAALGWSVSAG
ncbi:MAG: iron ABC transporter permease, partial [Planctomycetota bacterium]